QNAEIEARFARFQEVLRGLREIRSRQNIPPKTPINFSARCDAATTALLEPMAPYFASMANAKAVAWRLSASPPATHAQISLKDLELFVDLEGLIDLDAEIARLDKERTRLSNLIAGKEKKLANADFTARAPAEVVEKERASLADVRSQLDAIDASLAEFRRRKST
ncbi:MAG TPA: valine--tRNA ligase, partial [Pirellulales bacterium]|nr:valine--tRNA ligase [Pirellulales bacterium]